MVKVLPLKLADALYYDLKYVAQAEQTTMAQIIRNHIEKPVTQRADQLNKQTSPAKQGGTAHLLRQFIYRGPTTHSERTDDEILYGDQSDE